MVNTEVKIKQCECGRGFTHCRECGSRNVYTKRFRSLEFSAAIGRKVTVYGCRRCSAETNETDPCTAPVRTSPTGYKPFQKPQELPAWGNLVPGTGPYLMAMNEFVTDLTSRGGFTTIQAYVEAKRRGWHPDAYDMDDDVKEALELAGLTVAGSSPAVGSHAPSPEVREASGITEAITLDDIIKNMQEESK